MTITQKFLPCLAIFAASLAAQNPTFTGIVSPASDLPPGVPNYGIAQGSVFDIYGANLGAATAVYGTVPLPTTTGLAGTTVTVSQGANSVTAPLIYVSASQLVAIMPSTAPLGTDTITVVFNGKSGSSTTAVVTSNFGISTVDGSGNNAAVITNPDYSLVTATNSAKPGDTLVLWGTGLGAITTGDAIGAGFGNLSAQIQVLVGGIPATIQYQGRTPGAIGLDQINFSIPASAPTGCAVSVRVRTTLSGGSTISNGPYIAIAANGGTCIDPTQSVSQVALPGLLAKSAIKLVGVGMSQNTALTANGTASGPATSSATVYLLSFSPSQLSAQAGTLNGSASLNNCISGVNAENSDQDEHVTATGLNGGTTVTLTSPSSVPTSLTASQAGFYSGQIASIPSGTWQLTTSGGSDVAALSFPFTVSAPLVWSNQVQLAGSTVDHTKPLTITWTGGDANSYVSIVGQAAIPNSATPYQVFFNCSAAASAGTFSIPSDVLAIMPTGINAKASLTVALTAYSATLPAVAGFDATTNQNQFSVNEPIIFK